MTKTIVTFIAAITIMLTVACGGKATSAPVPSTSPTVIITDTVTGQKYNVTVLEDSNRQLQLAGGVVSEGAFRAKVRAWLLTSDGASVCTVVKGLTTSEAADAATRLAGHDVQKANQADLTRAGAILLEECDRIK